jgi:hypothetical protein
MGVDPVAENSATIIDLNTYKARKRMVLGRPRDERHEHSPAIVPLGFHFFWPVLAWMRADFCLSSVEAVKSLVLHSSQSVTAGLEPFTRSFVRTYAAVAP